MDFDATPETGTLKDDRDDPDFLLKRAKKLVVETFNENSLADRISEENVYIVWFSKTLQNWKALLSTDVHDGRYYEITYNGDRAEAYVDTYVKLNNHVTTFHI